MSATRYFKLGEHPFFWKSENGRVYTKTFQERSWTPSCYETEASFLRCNPDAEETTAEEAEP